MYVVDTFGESGSHSPNLSRVYIIQRNYTPCTTEPYSMPDFVSTDI